MSAASSPGPNNLLLLAVLGIGAYYLMTRRVGAQPIYTARPTTTNQERTQLIGAGLNALGSLFRGFGGGSGSVQDLHGTYDGISAQPWDVTPYGPDGPRYNNPSAYVAGGEDGLAVNPVNVSSYDYVSDVYGSA